MIPFDFKMLETENYSKLANFTAERNIQVMIILDSHDLKLRPVIGEPIINSDLEILVPTCTSITSRPLRLSATPKFTEIGLGRIQKSRFTNKIENGKVLEVGIGNNSFKLD